MPAISKVYPRLGNVIGDESRELSTIKARCDRAVDAN